MLNFDDDIFFSVLSYALPFSKHVQKENYPYSDIGTSIRTVILILMSWTYWRNIAHELRNTLHSPGCLRYYLQQQIIIICKDSRRSERITAPSFNVIRVWWGNPKSGEYVGFLWCCPWNKSYERQSFELNNPL